VVGLVCQNSVCLNSMLYPIKVIPMAHAPETGAINRLRFFLAPVSGVCVMQIRDWIRLVPEFRRRLEHCSIPSQKVACTRLRNSTAQKYIINIVHKSKFLLSVHCNAQHGTEHKITRLVYFLRQKCSYQIHNGTKNRRRKPAPESGVDLWRRFLERLSWVFVSKVT